MPKRRAGLVRSGLLVAFSLLKLYASRQVLTYLCAEAPSSGGRRQTLAQQGNEERHAREIKRGTDLGSP